MFVSKRGRDRVVGIAIQYGLDSGPGIKSQWGAFSAPVQIDPKAHSASYTMGTSSFPGVRWPGRGVNNSLSSSAEVKERVQLHMYSVSGLSCLITG